MLLVFFYTINCCIYFYHRFFWRIIFSRKQFSQNVFSYFFVLFKFCEKMRIFWKSLQKMNKKFCKKWTKSFALFCKSFCFAGNPVDPETLNLSLFLRICVIYYTLLYNICAFLFFLNFHIFLTQFVSNSCRTNSLFLLVPNSFRTNSFFFFVINAQNEEFVRNDSSIPLKTIFKVSQFTLNNFLISRYLFTYRGYITT